MDGSQVLGVGLATLAHALKSRRTILLEELRQVEQDLESVDRTLAAAERMGFDGVGSPSGPKPATSGTATHKPDGAARTDAGSTARQGAGVRVPWPFPRTKEDYVIHEAALASVGPYRDDKAIPPKADKRGRSTDASRVLKNPEELAAVRESVRDIAEKAIKRPPGPGGRRHLSAKGLVPGEPLAPILRRVVEAADRPLSTSEVTQAFLQVRKLELEGRELAALANRVSSLLSTDATKGWVKRIRQDGSRVLLWQGSGQSSG